MQTLFRLTMMLGVIAFGALTFTGIVANVPEFAALGLMILAFVVAMLYATER
jgi:hypothetical protein